MSSEHEDLLTAIKRLGGKAEFTIPVRRLPSPELTAFLKMLDKADKNARKTVILAGGPNCPCRRHQQGKKV